METLRWRSVWSGGLALAWALVAVTAGGGPPSYAAGPGAAIVVNPTGGPPNATVQVQGTGYNPGEQVRLLFDGALWSTAVAGDSGAFVRNAAIPGSAPPGPHQIRAEGLGGSPPSQVNFNVVVVTTTTTSTTTTSTTTTSTTSPSTTTTSPSTTTTSPSTTTTGSTTTTTTTGGSTTTRLPAPGTPAEEPPRPPPPGDQTTTAPTTTQTTQPGAPGTTGPGSTTGPSISGSPGASPRPGTAPVPALVPTVPLVGPTLPPLEPGPAGAPVTRITLAVIAAAGNRASTVPLGQYSS
ncbi:MAG: hypothetical protein ACRDZW_08395, partial [Acidimicrobiales bacterium]